METRNGLSDAQHAPKGFIDHNDTENPVCPNCGYVLSLEEAHNSVINCTVAGCYAACMLDDECIPDGQAREYIALCPSCELDFAMTAERGIRFSTSKKEGE